MILPSLALAAHCLGAGSTQWKASIFLDSLVSIPAGDTIKIRGPAQIIATRASAGIRVAGTLVLAGDESNRISFEGGRGIQIAAGGSAFFSGIDLSRSSQGLVIQGGEATALDSRFTATAGHHAVTIEDGALVLVRTELIGRSAALVGRHGDIDLDDVVVRSDTLWNLDPQIRARFQDVEIFGRVRIGQDPPLLHTHAAKPDANEGFHMRWTAAPAFGARIASDQSSRDAGTIPVSVTVGYGPRVAASLYAGWRSGWLDGGRVFNDRDQTMGKLQLRLLPFLEIGIEGGYGGPELAWNMDQLALARGLLDRGLDLEEPFAAPGPLAGGRIRLLRNRSSGLETEAGAAYQWRGSAGAVELGDLSSAWLSLARETDGHRTGIVVHGVHCQPDRVAGAEGGAHWQWTALADHRQDMASREWGGEFALEGREDHLLAERSSLDFLWGPQTFRIGPALSELAATGRGFWTAAIGPGLRVRQRPLPGWYLDGLTSLRLHRDATERAWFGADLSLKVSGGF